MKTVAVIGSGSWGTALAVQLKRAGNNVILGLLRKKRPQRYWRKEKIRNFFPALSLTVIL